MTLFFQPPVLAFPPSVDELIRSSLTASQNIANAASALSSPKPLPAPRRAPDVPTHSPTIKTAPAAPLKEELEDFDPAEECTVR